MRGRGRVLLDAVPPGAGAVVMGTGIVSLALASDGERALSVALLVVAGAAWAALAVLLAVRARQDRARLRRDASLPVSLTGVAGTSVLGAALAALGVRILPAALLAVAGAVALALATPVRRGWRTPTVGASFLAAVAPQALAALASAVAVDRRDAWLIAPAALLAGCGLAVYAGVLRSFDFGQLARAQGDHWIAGGAVAVAALAWARVAAALIRLGGSAVLRDGATAVAVAAWAAAVAWLAVLVAVEAAHPRVRVDARRWATVFPLGMYAGATFAVARVVHEPWMADGARCLTWVALAAWVAVAAATAGNVIGVVRDLRGRIPPPVEMRHDA